LASMDTPADRPLDAGTAPAAIVRPTYITWVTLAFMTTASVASLRSAPTMAVYGLTCVFLYIVPATASTSSTARGTASASRRTSRGT